MKKILVMSAFVAFSAAFVACSSNDDLVQQKPDVPEESVEEGIPMTVKVADLVVAHEVEVHILLLEHDFLDAQLFALYAERHHADQFLGHRWNSPKTSL